MIIETLVTPNMFDALYAALVSFITAALVWVTNKFGSAKRNTIVNAVSNQFDDTNPESIISKLKSIEAELKTNGGTSTKDLLLKTHSQMQEVVIRVSAVEGTIRKVEATQDMRTRMILNQANDPIFFLSPDGSCVFSNATMKKFTGLTDCDGNKWLTPITKQSNRQNIKTALSSAIKDQIPFRIDDVEMMNQLTRELSIVTIVVEPFFNSDRSVLQWNGVIKIKSNGN